MSWFSNFMTSSIGKKLIMSLTGLFLILFLIVHLAGNLQLLKNDGGVSFNAYSHLMSHNPFIEVISIGLYLFILLHSIQGIMLAYQNRKARGVKKYAITYSGNKSWASSNMALLGTLILVFILIHMSDFWLRYKILKVLPLIHVEGIEMQDMYGAVQYSFSQLWVVIVYVISMIVLYFHLMHGFSSAFQTLGLSSNKYKSVVKFLGTAYAILVPLGFAIIPIIFYLSGKG